MRRAGTTRLRTCYRWAIEPEPGDLAHLFWFLTGQDNGKSMCGRAVFNSFRTLRTFGIGTPAKVCPRCREIGLPGHPLPRGMM